MLFFRNFSYQNKLYVNGIHEGRISFAYEGMTEFPLEIVKISWKDITHLDLSGNNISNFEFLSGFVHLKSLIVDENLRIGSNKTRATFPTIPKLELFYANNCDINVPADFILQISSLFANLKYLSLMEWKTVLVDEKNFHRLRMFAIFMNPFLNHYNDKVVMDDERDHAQKCHQYLGTIDCTAPSTVSVTREYFSKVIGIMSQEKGEITKEIEDFFENDKIEKLLNSKNVAKIFN